jgi:hypothetical protein
MEVKADMKPRQALIATCITFATISAKGRQHESMQNQVTSSY